jgi:hypothetical protein
MGGDSRSQWVESHTALYPVSESCVTQQHRLGRLWSSLPRIAAGTVFRAQTGTIDPTSVLRMMESLWNLRPLTARDAAAPDLIGVLTLATPRTDDPLQGVTVPVRAFRSRRSRRIPLHRSKLKKERRVRQSV